MNYYGNIFSGFIFSFGGLCYVYGFSYDYEILVVVIIFRF